MESYSTAVSDFRRARGRAALQDIVSKLTGDNSELLSYEDVRRKVRAYGVIARTVKDVPLDAIVGSVGRYNDFTRTFLPKQDSDEYRWARVKVATMSMTGLPPVELYQIGQAYFVADGHHRVSVARQNGQVTIQAYVTEVRSKVPLEVDNSPDDLILKAEEAEFLARTNIDEMYPDLDLRVTCPGRYHMLTEHIDVHRYYMGIEQEREIPYQEAVAHWYENVYLPIIRIINDQGIMQDFPGRTEADLYLWIAQHRSELEDLLGWDVPVGPAAADFASLEGKGSSNLFARLGQRVLEVVIPDELEGPPKTGQWRLERATLKDRLFPELLVGLSTQDSSWLALEQAIPIAMREGGRVSGIFVVREEAGQESEEAISIRDRFFWRCGEVGLEGRFVTDVGPVAKTLCSRARWSDLLILNLAHRPGKSARSRWTSGFRKLLQRCTRPVLAVPDRVTEMARPLLVYDGGPQSDEAMYVATYMADQWQLPLVVLSIESDSEEPKNQEKARSYLERHSVQAKYLVEEALDWAIILEKASEYACDFLVMGTFDRNPVIGAVTGSAILDFLDETTLPILVCR